MPSAEHDVAALVRMKAARDAAVVARQLWERRRAQLPAYNRLQSFARSRWPACIALLRALAEDYQQRSDDLGIIVEVEERVRLRAWLPEMVIYIARSDKELATRLLFRMSRDGRTFCKIDQMKGRWQANLNRDDRAMDMSERNLRPLLRTIAQIMIVR